MPPPNGSTVAPASLAQRAIRDSATDDDGDVNSSGPTRAVLAASSDFANALELIAAGFDALARAVASGRPARRWYSAVDAAAYACTTVRALSDARRRQELTGTRSGRAYVYAREELDRWLTDRCDRPAQKVVTSLREHLRSGG